MLITRETDYAIRLIRGLADGQRHAVKPLCEQEQIPWKFAYKILGKLRQASIVKSVSGVHGGCQLIQDLNSLTLFDVINAVDENRYVSECLQPGYKCTWKSAKGKTVCSVHENLRKIQEDIDQNMMRCTMYDLLNDDMDL